MFTRQSSLSGTIAQQGGIALEEKFNPSPPSSPVPVSVLTATDQAKSFFRHPSSSFPLNVVFVLVKGHEHTRRAARLAIEMLHNQHGAVVTMQNG
jgi:hypothetical protein